MPFVSWQQMLSRRRIQGTLAYRWVLLQWHILYGPGIYDSILKIPNGQGGIDLSSPADMALLYFMLCYI
jgi:hypothetical protein